MGIVTAKMKQSGKDKDIAAEVEDEEIARLPPPRGAFREGSIVVASPTLDRRRQAVRCCGMELMAAVSLEEWDPLMLVLSSPFQKYLYLLDLPCVTRMQAEELFFAGICCLSVDDSCLLV